MTKHICQTCGTQYADSQHPPDNCAICDNPEQVEMHHVRHIRKRGKNVQGFTLYMAAVNRKQIPVCRKCHREIHNGKYDGASLPSILEQLQALKTVS